MERFQCRERVGTLTKTRKRLVRPRFSPRFSPVFPSSVPGFPISSVPGFPPPIKDQVVFPGNLGNSVDGKADRLVEGNRSIQQ
jgi:hypothetical protein